MSEHAGDRKMRAIIIAFSEAHVDRVVVQQNFIIAHHTEKISLDRGMYMIIDTRVNSHKYIGERYTFGCVHSDIRALLVEYRRSCESNHPLPDDNTPLRAIRIEDFHRRWYIGISKQGTIYTFYLNPMSVEISHDDFMKILRYTIDKKTLLFSYT